jgi:enamine deaminase RidA (YjgF/YER057c/UK114 family)
MVYVSGQISGDAKGRFNGKLGDDFTVEQGQAAAKTCAISLIAQVKSACDGDLDRLVQVVKLGGFVNSTQDFADHPAVINGASDFIGEVFGDAGKHARAAVGSSSLPLGVAVEIEGIFQIK